MFMMSQAQALFALMILTLTGACATHTKNISIVGDVNLELKTSVYAELEKADWNAEKDQSCVTHLYRCAFDSTGTVTQIEPMDLSSPAFKEFSDEAMRSWSFKTGKSGQCFVDYIYSRDGSTRVLIIPEELAQDVVEKRTRLRAEREKPGQKAKVKSLKQVTPKYPREAALNGQAGVVTVRFDVNPDGIPENFQVQRSVPLKVFDFETLRSLRQWRYPTLTQEPDKQRQGIQVTVYYKREGTLGYECELGY